jgi:hypothetical protein
MTQARAAAEDAPAFMVTEQMIDERNWERGQAPFFRVDTVAKVFFGMSASWLRLKLKADKEHPDTWFVHQGKRMDFRRSDPDRTDSARVFTLADIEPMAWSLYRFGAANFDSIRLAKILRIVQAVAILYKLIPTESEEDEAETAAE